MSSETEEKTFTEADLQEMKQRFEEQAKLAFELQQQYSAQATHAYQLKKQLIAMEDAVGKAHESDTRRQLQYSTTGKLGDYSIVDTNANFLSNCCVVLVRTSGPINLGQISRVCANLGVTDIRIVNAICEINCSDSRKFASHSLDLLINAPVFTNLQDAVHDCSVVIGTSGRKRGQTTSIEKPFLTPEETAGYLRERSPEKYALVFGNESNGLDKAELHHCDALLCIPARTNYPVFNLGHAVVITLYTLSRLPCGEQKDEDRKVDGKDAKTANRKANRASLDRLSRYLTGSLERFEYFRTDLQRQQCHMYIDDVLRQANISQSPVNALHGVLKHINRRAFGDIATEMTNTGRAPQKSVESTEETTSTTSSQAEEQSN